MVVFQYLYVYVVEGVYLVCVVGVVFMIVGNGDYVIVCVQLVEWMDVIGVCCYGVIDQIVGDYYQVWCYCVVVCYYFGYLVFGEQVVGVEIG